MSDSFLYENEEGPLGTPVPQPKFCIGKPNLFVDPHPISDEEFRRRLARCRLDHIRRTSGLLAEVYNAEFAAQRAHYLYGDHHGC